MTGINELLIQHNWQDLIYQNRRYAGWKITYHSMMINHFPKNIKLILHILSLWIDANEVIKSIANTCKLQLSQHLLDQSQQWNHQKTLWNLLKVNNEEPKWRHWLGSGAFIVDFEQISQHYSVFYEQEEAEWESCYWCRFRFS